MAFFSTLLLVFFPNQAASTIEKFPAASLYLAWAVYFSCTRERKKERSRLRIGRRDISCQLLLVPRKFSSVFVESVGLFLVVFLFYCNRFPSQHKIGMVVKLTLNRVEFQSKIYDCWVVFIRWLTRRLGCPQYDPVVVIFVFPSIRVKWRRLGGDCPTALRMHFNQSDAKWRVPSRAMSFIRLSSSLDQSRQSFLGRRHSCVIHFQFHHSTTRNRHANGTAFHAKIKMASLFIICLTLYIWNIFFRIFIFS